MKKHVVIARFDPETDAQLTAWKQLALKMMTAAPANSSEWPPHMTIAAYEDAPVEGLIRWCDEFAAEHSPIEIVFANLGLIPHGPNRPTDVLSVAPCNSLALTQFYYDFHAKYDEFAGEYGRRYSAAWVHPVFHSTIAICKKEELHSVLSPLCDVFRPVCGRIVALELCENPYRLVHRAEL